MKKKSLNGRLSESLQYLIVALFLLSPRLCPAAVDIATHPLIVAEPVPPNLFYILDDSGSMNRDDMPDTISCSGATGGTANVIRSDTGKLNSSASTRCQSPDFNKLYYNPDFTYSIPVDASGATLLRSPANAFSHAYVDGYSSSNNTYNDLTTWVSETWSSSKSTYTSGWVCTSRSGSSPNYTYSGCGNASGKSPIYGYIQLTQDEIFSYYRLISGRPAGSSNDADYQKVMAQAAEYQNIANWYAYYRTRLFTARAGTSLAFNSIPNSFRVGWGRINYTSSTGNTKESGVLPFLSTHRTNLYDWLFSVQATGSTPLRRALDDVGKYYANSEPWREIPDDSNSKEISCRASFSILMTDGYWTDGSSYQASTTAATKNIDGTDGTTTITNSNRQTFQYKSGPPFSDSWSNTLADVAMYYWNRDLRPTLTNNVPTSESDPAFWQHMVTMTIGMGVDGTVNKQTAFDSILTGAAISWPSPTSKNEYKIDDLLHAAVNGRGLYFSAKSPKEFTEALKQSVATIQSRLASSTNLAVDGASLAAGTVIYKATFRSILWSGELAAYDLNPDGTISNTAKWTASSNLPDFTTRKIFTRSGGAVSDFVWGGLSSSQKTALGSQTILDYLRGDQSLETSNSGNLRTRQNRLGDIIHSNPVYVGNPDPYLYRGYPFTGARGHSAFATSQASRIPMVYVGANDGMLHGFNAESGAEVFAYVPEAAVNSNLASLANPAYSHRYSVDGELTAADVYVNSTWKTFLAGSMGRGGKSLFAIDISNPDNFQSSNMSWEASPSALGQSIGKPVISRIPTPSSPLPNGRWAAVYGNGYNSTNNQAALIILDLATGNVSTIDTYTGSSGNPNGLAAAYLWDAENDGTFETAYAGDLQGNVWRFDLTKNLATKLFQAVDSTGTPQPITAGVRVSRDPKTGKIWVFFGTGKYLGTNDPVDRQIQTWYGLIDDGTAISGRSQLLQRSILQETVSGSNTGRIISSGNASELTNKRGWYIDLNSGSTPTGERMLIPNQLLGSVSLVGVTLIPVGDDCNPGGSGYIMAIDPFSGGRLGFSFFDFSGNGIISPEDRLSGADASGVNFGSIPSNPTFKGTKMIVQTDQGQALTLTVNPPYPAGETQRAGWHELTND